MFKPRQLQLALAVMLALTGGYAYTQGSFDDRIAAAEGGDLTAQYELGRMYLEGDGIDRDEPRGVVFLKQATRHAEATDPESSRTRARAAMLLADYYSSAPSTPGNEGDYIVYLRQAALLGHTSAQVEIARRYLANAADPNSAPADRAYALKASMRTFEHAARAGDGDAAFELGRIYWDGRLVQKDVAQGEEWLQRAAESRNRSAAMLLASYYLDDASSDHYGPESGMRFLRLAADAGDARAMLRLAQQLEQGDLIPRDPEGALEWAKRAEARGIAQARPMVARLTEEMTRVAVMDQPADLPDVMLSTPTESGTDAFEDLDLRYALGAVDPAVAQDTPPTATAPVLPVPDAEPHTASVTDVIAAELPLDAAPQPILAAVVEAAEPRTAIEDPRVLAVGETSPPPAAPEVREDPRLAALLVQLERLTDQVAALTRRLTERDERIAELETAAKTATAERMVAAATQAPRDDNLLGVAAFREGKVGDAIQFFERAIAAGDIEAYSNMAVALLRGKPGTEHVNRAVSLLEQAAELNSGKAAYNLALINEAGSYGLPASPAQARFWFTRAAELGHEAATLRMRGESAGVPSRAIAAIN